MGSVPCVTPSVIRGESPAEILIDTFSVTLPISALYQIAGKVSRWTHSNEEIQAAFQKFLNFVFSPIFTCEEIKGGRNFFENSISFEQGGFVAFGGNNSVRNSTGDVERNVEPRFQIYIPGDSCVCVRNWAYVATKLASFSDVRITRLDIAADFHNGEYTLQHFKDLYADDAFTTAGRPPKAKLIDDFGSNDGSTFYVGDRKNGKMARIYEKGKQLGDKLSNWLRVEGEVHSKDREIPLDALRFPKKYLAAMYPAFFFISEVREVIKTSRVKLQIQYEVLRGHAKRQYGKLLNFAHLKLGLDKEQIFYEILEPGGFPDRLTWSNNAQLT